MDVKKINQYVLPVTLFFLLTIHFFFDLYRGAAFAVTPNDNDYLYYLLYIVGEPEGYIPESPFIYRLFSVLLVVPFYEILPFFKFSGLSGESSDIYLKAQQSLAFVSYCCSLMTLTLIYLITRHKFQADSFTAVVAVLIAFIIFRHTGLYNIDLIAISIICLIYYFLDKKILYAILIFISVGFNEKVAMLFAMIMASRWLFSRVIFSRRLFSKWSFSVSKVEAFYFIIPSLAVIGFLLLKKFTGVEGNEHQTDVSVYISSLQSNLFNTFDFKGIYLNILPFFILLLFYYFGVKEYLHKKGDVNSLYFNIFDILPLIAFFVLLHLLNVQYNVGRILIYSFPFFLPLAVLYLKRLLLKY